jgi:hypothetical protein
MEGKKKRERKTDEEEKKQQEKIELFLFVRAITSL